MQILVTSEIWLKMLKSYRGLESCSTRATAITDSPIPPYLLGDYCSSRKLGGESWSGAPPGDPLWPGQRGRCPCPAPKSPGRTPWGPRPAARPRALSLLPGAPADAQGSPPGTRTSGRRCKERATQNTEGGCSGEDEECVEGKGNGPRSVITKTAVTCMSFWDIHSINSQS